MMVFASIGMPFLSKEPEGEPDGFVQSEHAALHYVKNPHEQIPSKRKELRSFALNLSTLGGSLAVLVAVPRQIDRKLSDAGPRLNPLQVDARASRRRTNATLPPARCSALAASNAILPEREYPATTQGDEPACARSKSPWSTPSCSMVGCVAGSAAIIAVRHSSGSGGSVLHRVILTDRFRELIMGWPGADEIKR